MAVLQIEIGQRDAPVLLVGEMPGETGRDRGRPDAAARPDAGDELADLLAERRAALGLVGDGLRQQLRRHRLEEVFGDAGLDQVAIERDIVAVADRDDRDRRLADIGKIVHPRDREIFAADIDDQNAGRALAREVLDRLADVAAQDAQRRYSGRCGAVDDRGLGRRVGDKGQQRQAPGRRFRGGVDRRGALGLVQRDRDGGGGGSHHGISGSRPAAALERSIGLSAV